MRRRWARTPAPLEPPARVRRFEPSEWGWWGPNDVDGYITTGYHEAHLRYLDAWSARMDEHGVDLIDWFEQVRG